MEADQDVQDIMQYILEDCGYEVHLTDSETTALDIKTVKPDLILLDDWVAKNDPAFCKRLKKESLTPNVPVILTTTKDNAEQVAEKFMADDVLSKPFDLQDLVDKVTFWLKKVEVHRLSQ